METTPIDAFQIYTTAGSTAKLPGAAAEVGVFKGATARLILEALPNKIVHLCGYFPRDTGHELQNERFSFVHLDLDYYDGTL